MRRKQFTLSVVGRNANRRRKKLRELQSGISERTRRSLYRQRLRIMRAGKTKPCTVEELQAIAAASDVKVKKLPAGAHVGWTPSWF